MSSILKKNNTNSAFLISLNYLKIVRFSLIFSHFTSLYAQEIILPNTLEYTIQNSQSIQQLSTIPWMIQEGKSPLTIQEILAKDFKDATIINHANIEPIIAPFETYWFALSLKSGISINNWLLFLKEKWYRANFIKGYPSVTVYFTRNGQVLRTEKTGSEIPASDRSVNGHATMSLLQLDSKAGEDFLIWVALSNNELERPVPEIYLYDAAVNLPTFTKDSYIIFGLSMGVTLLLLVISFFLWIWIKEGVYGWFVIILSLMGLTELLVANEEWLVKWFFREHGHLRFRIAMFLALALRVFLLQFGRVFINLSRDYPKLDMLFKVLIWITIFGLGIVGLFFPRGDALSLDVWSIWTVLLVIYSLIMCVVCIQLIRLPNWLARIYGLGTGLFFSTPILGPLFQNLGIAQAFFNPESLGPIGMTLTMLFGLVYRFWEVEQQKTKQLRQINIVSNKFVPKTFLNFLGKNNILDATLGDYVEKQVTVMFSDIRDYTSLSEKMTPKENFRFVNKFNQRMGPIIQHNKGFINQYLGDGLMAIFPEKVADTLNAAIGMQQDLIEYNAIRIKKNRIPLRMGIGIHAGPLVMGIIGYAERLDAAIISDTVNAAARLERLTKYFKVSIIISSSVVDDIDNTAAYNFRYLGLVQVKGKQQALKIYECFDGDKPVIKVRKRATKAQFNQGIIAYFSKEFEAADKYLSTVLLQNPSDYTAQLFYDKNKGFLENGIPDNWTGVEVINLK